MEFIMNYLLTLILFSPVLIAIVVILLPQEEVKLVRWVAFLGSLIPLALSFGSALTRTNPVSNFKSSMRGKNRSILRITWAWTASP